MRMSELLNEVNKFELDEGFSPKEIKMAIGVASDPRYAKGNMTGAVTAIEKLKKGLSDHPKVAAVLRRQNEDVKEAVSPAQQAAIAISKKEKTKNEVLDKDDEKTVGDVIKGLKKAVKAHQGQVKNLTKDIQDQVELDELKVKDIVIAKTGPHKGVKHTIIHDFGDGRYNIKPNDLSARQIRYRLGALTIKGTDLKLTKEEVESITELTAEEKRLINMMYDKKGNLTPLGKKVMDQGKKEEVEENALDIQNESDYTIDEGKMKDLAMKIDRVASNMRKDRMMKPFADKFKKDAMKSMNVRKSLEKVLPDYVAGKTLDKVMKEEVEVQESGHTDVASAMTNVKVAMSALTKMSGELSKLSPEDALPSWWTNKVAIAVDKLDGMADYLDTQVEEVELDEAKFSPKEIKMAIGIASDKRYAGGNMTGAVKAIEKMKKGLSDHPQVMAVLKRQNEEVELDEKAPKIGVDRLKLQRDKDKSHADAMGRHVKSGRRKSVKDEVELDEGKMKDIVTDVEDAMGKIKYKLSQKGGKLIIKVSSNDERDAQKAMKMNPLYIAGKLRVVSESFLIAATVNRITRTEARDIDPADIDVRATDKDVDNASKNIILQLRKVINLRGVKPVEFASGKEKVHPNVAAAALTKHENMRRADDKEAFQRKIARSYKDLLNAVKGK